MINMIMIMIIVIVTVWEGIFRKEYKYLFKLRQ